MVILSAIPMSAQMVTQQLQMNGKRHKEAEVLYQIPFSFFFFPNTILMRRYYLVIQIIISMHCSFLCDIALLNIHLVIDIYLHHKICSWVFHQLKSTRTTTGLILPASDKTYRRFCCCLFWCFCFVFLFSVKLHFTLSIAWSILYMLLKLEAAHLRSLSSSGEII